MLLSEREYKKYVTDHFDILNEILKKNYNYHIRIIVLPSGGIAIEKIGMDDKNNIYFYEEDEGSLAFIDRYICKYVNFYLFTPARQRYLLDVIKRLGNVDHAENVLQEAIRKGYIF